MELLNFWLEAPGDAARWLRGIIARRADYSPAEPRSVSPELISQTLSLGGAGLKSKGLAKPSKRAPKQRGHSNAAGDEIKRATALVRRATGRRRSASS